MDLQHLEEIQRDCAQRVVKEDLFKDVRWVGGIDLTFESIKETPTKAWACLVVVQLKDLKPVYTEVVEGTVDFPYIPTFLAFRELPLMLRLYEKAKIKPDVFLIDGQGVAHPRGCGIASHFGVETDSVTIGVAKTKLWGVYREPSPERGSFSPLLYRGSVIGVALRTKAKTAPVFVSVGHKISLKTAIDIVLKTSVFRIPEPIRLAHNTLQRVRKGWLG
ncbi:Deoxyribonuclease V [Thermocrinis albus DSM 14484]|uniref:Endonuclease V n=1 Tax=Thermocrinis albus (strain DSM 14484 / JCM 11386 / HI 11/12) TaxID=638303 RepID=D3SLA4_THEAH|nr:endonuclease V [Thermocrinis albus]ADC89534.1 Deoxyribonuclease V [Thermocrinis albus DSM 14484]